MKSDTVEEDTCFVELGRDSISSVLVEMLLLHQDGGLINARSLVMAKRINKGQPEVGHVRTVVYVVLGEA